MTTCSLRRIRLILLTLVLGIVFSGLALADGAPVCQERQSGRSCAPAMTPATGPAGLQPVGLDVPAPKQTACFWAWYEEYWKNGQICRTYNSCTGQRWGSCPNGYDFKTNEVFQCCN